MLFEEVEEFADVACPWSGYCLNRCSLLGLVVGRAAQRAVGASYGLEAFPMEVEVVRLVAGCDKVETVHELKADVVVSWEPASEASLVVGVDGVEYVDLVEIHDWDYVLRWQNVGSMLIWAVLLVDLWVCCAFSHRAAELRVRKDINTAAQNASFWCGKASLELVYGLPPSSRFPYYCSESTGTVRRSIEFGLLLRSRQTLSPTVERSVLQLADRRQD